MVALYGPALLTAFLITVLEMTEVVVLVVAVGSGTNAVRHGALGAVAGTAFVAIPAVLSAAAIRALPAIVLLALSSLLLGAFGVFLFRSTLKSFRRARAPGPRTAAAVHDPPSPHLPFAGGFSVGAVETFEAVVVLVAISAAGYSVDALIGALAGGALLLGLGLAFHAQIRRIKIPWLKLGATSLLFTFAVFWGGEALAVRWPGGDLILLPLFLAALVLVRLALEPFLPPLVPVEPKG